MIKQGSAETKGPAAQPSGAQHAPWLGVAVGGLAALAFGVLILAWALGGPRGAEWIEQPVAAPNAGAKP